MVGFYLGPQRTVILNTADLINEAMGMDDLADRPQLPSLETVRGSLRYCSRITTSTILS